MAGGWDHVLLQNPVPGDIVACLLEMGMSVYKVDNSEAQAPCPVHYERTGKAHSRGDWSINIEDGMHNCFSCGFSGQFVDLAQAVLGCSREEAVLWTKARGGIERVRNVLYGSGLADSEAEEVQESDLALYVPVPEKVCASRDIEPWAADEYRVLWDTERDMWITQIREFETDRLIGWQEKGKKKFNNHPQHMEKSDHLFGINDVPEDCHIGIMVESPLDCPHILSAGIGGAFSTMGAKVSDRQLDIACERFHTIIAALDDDEAGYEINRDLRKRVGGRANLRFWNYGKGSAKDPGEQSLDQVRKSYRTAYNAILSRW